MNEIEAAVPHRREPRTAAGRAFHANEHGAVCSFAETGSCALVNDETPGGTE